MQFNSPGGSILQFGVGRGLQSLAGATCIIELRDDDINRHVYVRSAFNSGIVGVALRWHIVGLRM